MDYKRAFGVKFDEETSIIGPIPSLADATIIAEIHFKEASSTLRISTWERISIANHIYRQFILDVLQNGRLKQTYKIARFQGVLG